MVDERDRNIIRRICALVGHLPTGITILSFRWKIITPKPNSLLVSRSTYIGFSAEKWTNQSGCDSVSWILLNEACSDSVGGGSFAREI